MGLRTNSGIGGGSTRHRKEDWKASVGEYARVGASNSAIQNNLATELYLFSIVVLIIVYASYIWRLAVTLASIWRGDPIEINRAESR